MTLSPEKQKLIEELANTLARDGEQHRAQCNKWTNGECRTRNCLIRGGYNGIGPFNPAFATCEHDEFYIAEQKALSLLTELAQSLTGEGEGADCLICGRFVPDYVPERCCDGFECNCQGQPTNPCVCSVACDEALMSGIGKPYEQRRIDANIPLHVDALESQLSALKSELETVKTENAGLITAGTGLNDLVTQLRSELEEVRAKMTDASLMGIDAHAQVESLRTQLAETQAKLEEAQQTIKEYTEQLKEYNEKSRFDEGAFRRITKEKEAVDAHNLALSAALNQVESICEEIMQPSENEGPHSWPDEISLIHSIVSACSRNQFREDDAALAIPAESGVIEKVVDSVVFHQGHICSLHCSRMNGEIYKHSDECLALSELLTALRGGNVASEEPFEACVHGIANTHECPLCDRADVP